jgi:hypothetical protein
MSKDAYYFSHDSNARNDDKIVAVRMRYGIEGYGIYFILLEKLRESSDYACIKDYNVIAFDLRVSSDKVKSIIEDFGLFAFTDDGKRFYSESLTRRMRPLDELREKRSEAGKVGMKKRWKLECPKRADNSVITVLQQTDNNKSKVKNSKEEENKEKSANADEKKVAAGKLPKEKTWRDSFETYRQELRSAYMQATEDKKWLAERQRYHPGLNILLTLEKACKDYWSKEAGWKKKKAAKTANIDWPRTFNNALAIDSNKVWKTKKQIESEENEQKKHIHI